MWIEEALVHLQLPISHWKMQFVQDFQRSLWRLNTTLVSGTYYIGRSFLTTCLKSLWSFSLLLRIRDGAWLLLMTGQSFKNNESHSSYSPKIGRSMHWLGSCVLFFSLSAIFTIFSPEPHSPYHCESQDTSFMVWFCRKPNVLCILCPFFTSVLIDKMESDKESRETCIAFSLVLYLSALGSYKKAIPDLKMASGSALLSHLLTSLRTESKELLNCPIFKDWEWSSVSCSFFLILQTYATRLQETVKDSEYRADKIAQ